MENLLILFLKYPEPERVKTRLGRDIGFVQAARIYEKMVLQQISDLTCGVAYDLALYVDDRHEIASYKKKFGGSWSYFYQRGENLGKRMAQAMTDAFQLGYTRVVLMGSDVPRVDVPAVNHFFDHLVTADMVIGPAVDGGFYMIGFQNKIDVFPVFENITWSAATVFEHTMGNAADLKVQVEKIWFDVDTAGDLGMYEHLLETGGTFSEVEITSYYPVS